MGITGAPLPMADERIRRQIAFLAAQLMYHRTESEYFTAKRKAAKQLGVEYRFRPGDLPSNAEIRDQIQSMARVHEGPKRLDKIRDMRLEALRLMRKLARFRPRLIGSVWTGHVRQGSDIDIHLFSDSLTLVTEHPRRIRPDLRGREEADRQAWRGAGLHPHPRRGPVPLRADALPRGQGPLRLQKLDHRPGDRAGLDRRAGAALQGRGPRDRPRLRGRPGRGPGRPLRDLTGCSSSRSKGSSRARK